MHSCRCGSEWAGKVTAHCASCHRTFSGPTYFDKHRRRGACVDPADLGMSDMGRAYSCLGYPDTDSRSHGKS